MYGNPCVNRGGNYNNSDNFAGTRYGNNADNNNDNNSFRPL